MLCQKCKKNEATVHYKKVVNGKQTEMYLCPECADGLGSFDFGFDNFLPSLFGHFMKPEIRPAVVMRLTKNIFFRPLREFTAAQNTQAKFRSVSAEESKKTMRLRLSKISWMRQSKTKNTKTPQKSVIK